MLSCNNTVSFKDFSILANGANDSRIKLQEDSLISLDRLQ